MVWWKKQKQRASEATKKSTVKVHPLKVIDIEKERFYVSQLELDKPIPKLNK